jgi:hypothetical protein
LEFDIIAGGGGVVAEFEEWVLVLATKVPLRVANRRSRRVLEASCSRLAASSFWLRTTGSSDRD